MANSDFNGHWRIDRAHSSWSDGLFPPDMRLDLFLEFHGNSLRYHSENSTDMTKPPATLDFDVTLGGDVAPLAGSARFNTVKARQISEYEFEILEMLEGDVIVAAYWRFSPDGKEMWRWGVGKSPVGKSRAYEELFRREV